MYIHPEQVSHVFDANDDVHTLPSNLSITLRTSSTLKRTPAIHVILRLGLLRKVSNVTHRPTDDQPG
jgi:hypothetical protein